jgi:tRNA(fMet)-specific endonuclease VapC
VIYLLDTDHVSILQGAGGETQRLRTRLKSLRSDDYGTTAVSYEEQCRGWLDLIHRSRDSESRVAAYTKLQDNLTFFSRIAVWEYSTAADAKYLELLSSRVRVGTKDMRIACIALVNAATLLTRNTRDFEKIPGLLHDDWTQ